MSVTWVRARLAARAWLPVVLACGCCACGHKSVSDPGGSQCWGGSQLQRGGYQLIVKPIHGQSLDVLDRDTGLFAQSGVSSCDATESATHACLVHTLGSISPQVAAANLVTFGAGKVEYAVPNVALSLRGLPPPKPPDPVNCAGPVPPAPDCGSLPAPTTQPLDRCFGKQSELSALGAQEAWAARTDCSVKGQCPTVITALVDTGVQSGHEDLRCNLVTGKDFSCGNDNCGTKPEDHDGHGTHMAGIIAASPNETGVRGVAWNTEVMPLKVNVGGLVTNDWQAGAAIEYAVNNGASVISMSWSSPCPTSLTYDAIKDADARGVVVVSAPGNDGINIELAGNEQYPAIYDLPNTLTVMSYSKGWKPTLSSNWGPHSVDLAAPGGDYTTQVCTGKKPCYAGIGDDTSTATAYVAGAAALIKSRHPDWSAEWIKTLLMDSAIPERALQGKSRTGARMSLKRALVGPLQLQAPVKDKHWDLLVQDVRWDIGYRTSLCQAVDIDITLDHVNYQRIMTDAANNGQTRVQVLHVGGPKPPLPGHTEPPPPHQVWLRLSCQPGGFQYFSDPFWFDGPQW